MGLKILLLKLLILVILKKKQIYKKIYLIKEYCSTYREFGYNLSDGGFGNSGGVSKETGKKLSEANKGRKISDETRVNLSKSHTGKKASDETKKKMSEAKKGKKHSSEAIKKMKGRNFSQETRKKISKAMKGEKNHQSKLTDINREEIVKLYKTGYNQTQIAKMYNVTPSAIHYVLVTMTPQVD